jgi:CPA2 family monovalent cation:H+ antiporter-2
MMIDPAILVEYAGTVTIITLVTIVAKFFGTGIGALLAGCNIRNSMQAGMSMAQIGEFSFIIATLGKTLGVISDFLYPVAVAVSAVTTLTTPYLIKSSGSIAKWLDAWIPERIHLMLTRYEVAMTERTGREHVLVLIGKVHGLAVLLNSVVIIGVVWGVRFCTPWIPGYYETWWVNLVICCVTLTLASPFFWAILRSRPLHSEDYDAETLGRLQQLQIGVSFVRLFIGIIFLGGVVEVFIPTPAIEGLATILGFLAVLFLFGRYFESLYQKIETIFVSHLSAKERAVVEERAALSHMVPWEATLTEFSLSEYSPLVLHTLLNSNLKRDYGVTVAIIKRGTRNIVAPRSDEILLPCDKLYLIGTYEQLAAAQEIIEFQPTDIGTDVEDERFGMIPLRLHEGHSFVGKMILDCGLRESANGLIVGLERLDQRFLNPNPSMTLENGDLIWLVGERNKIRDLK